MTYIWISARNKVLRVEKGGDVVIAVVELEEGGGGEEGIESKETR